MELLIVLALVALVLVYAIERLNGFDDFRVQRYDLQFNGERLRGFCLVIDRRSPEQRQRNQQERRLDGDVLVFMHGHGQPPQYGYHFTSLLTQRSQSRLMVIPMVYTPFGRQREWRGDAGKILLLMALVRHALTQRGIGLTPSESICDLPLSLRTGNEFHSDGNEPAIPAQVTVIGWSHGGILARLFAHAYPSVVRNLAQITPAGFESWGQGQVATVNLMVSFQWEILRITSGIFRGEARPALVAGWAMLRGIGGDMLSAWKSMVTQPPIFLRLFRPLFDIQQCAMVMTDRNAAVQHLDHLVVLFGKSDSVFEARNALQLKHRSVQDSDAMQLFETYYPSARVRGTRCTFKELPGNHIAPMVYAELYAEELLRGLGQIETAEADLAA